MPRRRRRVIRLSLKAYARWRGNRSSTVHQALQEGRLTAWSAVQDPRTRRWSIDPERADREWALNTMDWVGGRHPRPGRRADDA